MPSHLPTATSKAAPAAKGAVVDASVPAKRSNNAVRKLKDEFQSAMKAKNATIRALRGAASGVSTRTRRSAEVLAGAAAGGALAEALPDNWLGPIGAREAAALGVGVLGYALSDEKDPDAIGDHLMSGAEGIAASIVSDLGRTAVRRWKDRKTSTTGSSASSAAPPSKSANEAEQNGEARGNQRKLRQVVLSQPEERRAGGGVPRV